MTAVLEFQNVVRAFGVGARVLDGAGKTTLIRIAMGMLFPQEGAVKVFGLSPMAEPVAVKRRVGYVAEDQVLPPFATVGELLAFHRSLFPSWDSGLERQLIDRFALSDRSRKIRALSKGQARQVALVLAVCHRPELLILDEPAGGLDPAARREFLETSIQLLNREGTSILFSSHHMGDVERLGGRVVLLDGAKVRLDLELDALREDHCIAILPRLRAMDRARVESVPGCLRVRTVNDETHAVFHGTPETVRWQLQQSLGLANARCERVPLEELFVELVGGERLEKAS